MVDARHKAQTIAEGIHTPISFEYANEAARLAAGPFESYDKNKFALQLDTNEIYVLTGTSPIVWRGVSGPGISGDLDMDGYDILNVGTVDGVDVSAHAGRHEAGGADAIEVADLGTAEVNVLLVLQPDGVGGVVWSVPSGGGDVVGPAGATDNAVALFDAGTGKVLKNSLVTIDGSGNISTPGTVDGYALGSEFYDINTQLDILGGILGGDLSGTLPNPTVVDLTITNEEQGSVLYFDGANWVQLPPGTDGYALITHDTGENPTWGVVAGTTPVTSVFGRVGDVIAAVDDYSASQIDNDSTVTGEQVSDALEYLDGYVASVAADVADVATMAVGGDLSGNLPNPSVVDLSITGEEQGSVLYFDGANWIQLPPGEDGYALITHNTGANPTWGEVATTAPVTSVFGRVGDVIAVVDDYSASQIDNDSSVPGGQASDALEYLDGYVDHAARHENGGPDEIEISNLGTSEVNNTLVLMPDGVGGVVWSVPSGGGDVSGPAGATDNAVALFDAGTGKVIKNSLVTIDGAGNISTPGMVDGYVLGSEFYDINAQLDILTGPLGGDLSGTLPNPSVVDLSITSEEQGSVLYFDGANWVQLPPGSDGYALITHDTGANPTWGEVATTAPVTSVFGRVGDVIAGIDDYSASQIDNDSTVPGEQVSDALEYLDALIELDGYVVGPSSATDNAVTLFDGVTGKIIKNSLVTIDGSGNISTPGTVDGYDLGTEFYDINAQLDILGGALGGDLSGTLPNPSVVDLTITGEEQGSVLYFDGTNWVQLPPGEDGYILTTNGSGANPEWSMDVLKLDQSNSQTIINGQPTVNDGVVFGSTPSVGDFERGKLYYDELWQTLSLQTGRDVTLQIGQEEWRRVYNDTGSTILNGKAVYTNGVWNGSFPYVATVDLAIANDDAKWQVLGIATQDIPDGYYGFISVRGHINGVNTDAWTAGDVLYLSDTVAGDLANVEPSPGNYGVRVGRVIRKDTINGVINVRIFSNSKLGDLANVVETSPSLDQVLTFNGVEWVNGNPASSSASPGIDFFNSTPVITARTAPAGLSQDGTAGNGIQINSLSKTPITTAEQTQTVLASNDTRAGAAWLYDTALGRTAIDAGIWDFTTYVAVSSTVGGSTVTRTFYQVVPGTGTLTFTGAGANSRTATITAAQYAGTYFVPSGTQTLASFIQATSGTDRGIYQITAMTDPGQLIATVTVRTGYTNETGVTYNIWNRLFSVTTVPLTSTAISQYDTVTSQPAFTIAATDKIGGIMFVTAGGLNRTFTIAYDGTEHNTHVSTPLITLHNNLAGLQGGSANERYHISSAQYTVVGNTSGTNTGDNAANSNYANDYRPSGPDVAVADGGTGLSAIAAGSILAANTANVLSAITNTVGTRFLTNVAGAVSWGDVSASLVDNDSTVPGEQVSDALEYLDGYIDHAARHEYDGGDPIDGYQIGLVYSPVNYDPPANNIIGEHIAAIDEVLASSGLVDSVFGRVGDVVAATDDYSASQIDNDSTVTGEQVSDALEYLDGYIGGHVSDFNNPHQTSISNIGSGTLAELNLAISDATLDDVSGTRTPTAHATSHEEGETDAIDGYQVGISYVPVNYIAPVNPIIGEHIAAIDEALASAGPVDSVFGRVGDVVSAIDDYAASQIDNDSTVTGEQVSDALEYLDGYIKDHSYSHENGGGDEIEISNLGTSEVNNALVLKPDGVGGVVWSVAASGGDVVGPAGATDNAVALFDAGTGKVIKNSLVTIDGSGNISTPGTVDGYALGTEFYDINTQLDILGGALGGDLSGSLPNPTVTDLTITSEEQGSVLYFDGANWVQLPPGDDGYVLTTHDTGENPTWEEAGGSGSGDVVGPAIATDSAIVRYDGSTGKLIQNSGILIDNSDNVSGITTLSTGSLPAQTGAIRLTNNEGIYWAGTGGTEFPGDRQFKLAITIPADSITGDISNDFWVRITHVTLPDAMITSGGAQALQPTGTDLAASLDEIGSTRIPLYVARCALNATPANSRVQIWVRRQDVSDSVDTDIWLWWGSETATAPAVGAPYGRNDVFGGITGTGAPPDGFSVWLFNENPTDPAPQYKDHTGGGHDATVAGTVTRVDLMDVQGAQTAAGVGWITTAFTWTPGTNNFSILWAGDLETGGGTRIQGTSYLRIAPDACDVYFPASYYPLGPGIGTSPNTCALSRNGDSCLLFGGTSSNNNTGIASANVSFTNSDLASQYAETGTGVRTFIAFVDTALNSNWIVAFNNSLTAEASFFSVGDIESVGVSVLNVRGLLVDPSNNIVLGDADYPLVGNATDSVTFNVDGYSVSIYDGYVDIVNHDIRNIKTATFNEWPTLTPDEDGYVTVDFASYQKASIDLNEEASVYITLNEPVGPGNFMLILKQGSSTATTSITWVTEGSHGLYGPYGAISYSQVLDLVTMIGLAYDGTDWFGASTQPLEQILAS